MNAIYIPSNDFDSLKNHLVRLNQNTQVKSFLFLMADEQHLTKKALDPELRKCDKRLIGGVFPELIFEGKRKKSGIVLVPLAFELKTQLFDLRETEEDFFQQLERDQHDSMDASSSLFVFTDALSINKESFLESLFNFFGIYPTYIGGGAGSLRFKPFPCIISNEGLSRNAAVIGWARKDMALGVAHGWKSISNPLKVTQVEGNKLLSLNWKPAFEVYREIVEEHSGMKFAPDNFFDIAKAYPLGISKVDAEMVVRDPFMENENALYLVDTVKQGEYLDILYGNLESLIEGASQARDMSITNSKQGMDKANVFCIDCISRVLFMKDAFVNELDIVGENANVNGILSIGEIANSEDSYLEIYNKTVVVGIW